MSDKKLPYYRMYPADAETDENFRLLTDEELGFYWRCLNASWNNKGLPEDPEMRCRSLRTERSEADRKWSNVERCFDLQNGRYVNKRQEKERELALQKSAINSTAGKASAERRFNARSTPVEQQESVEQRAYDASSCSGNSSLPEVRSIQRTEQPSSPKTRRRSKPIFKTPTHKAAFEEFWAAYWLRVARQEAEHAYIATVTTTGLHRKVMTAVAAQSAEMLSREPNKRKQAAGWLNGCRWNDEAPTPVKAQSSRNEPEYPTPAERRAYLEAQTGELQ